MLFKRRNKDSFWTRARIMFWPRRNHARSTRYVWKRVLRVRAKPHAIAFGFAAGAFASFTPFMGFHFILSFAIAWASRSSFISAGLGTAVGNPLTFPFIWAAALNLGRTIMGRSEANVGNPEGFMFALKNFGFGAVWDPYILPMIIGGVPLGLIAGTLFYFPIRSAARAFQARRSAKMEESALKRSAMGATELSK